MINGLVNGSLHGFHVHEFGDLSDMAAGLSVGGHYNPYNGTHSLPGYGNPHVGDLVISFLKFLNLIKIRATSTTTILMELLTTNTPTQTR